MPDPVAIAVAAVIIILLQGRARVGRLTQPFRTAGRLVSSPGAAATDVRQGWVDRDEHAGIPDDACPRIRDGHQKILNCRRPRSVGTGAGAGVSSADTPRSRNCQTIALAFEA